MHWPNADLEFVRGVARNLCFVFTLSHMLTVIFWKTKMNQAEGFVSTGVRLSEDALTNNKVLFQLLHALVGCKMLYNHLTYNKVLQVGTHVAISLMEVCPGASFL